MLSIIQTKKKSLKILLVLAGIGIILAGWLTWPDEDKIINDNSSNPQEQTSTPAERESIAQSETPDKSTAKDPFVGWDTYISEHGYSFRYPQDWTLKNQSSSTNGADSEFLVLHSNVESYGDADDFTISFGVSTKKEPNQYNVKNTQTLTDRLRAGILEREWASKQYRNYQLFPCPTLRLLAATRNTDIPLTSKRQLSGEGSFCNAQSSYTTKSETQQLRSSEWDTAIKIYRSIKFSGN